MQTLLKSLETQGFLVDALRNDRVNTPVGKPIFENLPVRKLNTKPSTSKNRIQTLESPIPRQLSSSDLEDLKNGIDTLAWYIPFHVSLAKWGIFVRARGVEILASELVSAGVPWEKAFDHGFNMLLAHELGHFKTEVLVSSHEISESRHIYTSGSRRLKLDSPWNFAEEAICSSLSYHQTSGFRHATKVVLDGAPVGYQDWRLFDMEKADNHWGTLLGLYCSGKPMPWASIDHISTTRAYNQMRKITLILDGSGPGGEVVGQFSYSH